MTPEKYEVAEVGLRANRRSVRVGSLVTAECAAAFYSARLPRLAKGTLADLGCGTSPLKRFYEAFVTFAVGLDWPASLHGSRPDVYGDLADRLPLRDRSVDVILASDLVEHLPAPNRFFEECVRVLRDGGFLIGNTPFLYRLHEEPHDYQRLTEHGLRLALSDAGFASAEIEVLGGGVDSWVDLTAKLVARAPRIGRPFASLLERGWIRARRHQHPRAASETVRIFPLGYGFVARVSHR